MEPSNREEQEQWDEYCKAIESSVQEELEGSDPVRKSIRLHSFVSRSKGWRNGKRRLRARWKEIDLLSYRHGPFHTWQHFPFDVYSTEVLGDIPASDRIPREEVRKRAGR